MDCNMQRAFRVCWNHRSANRLWSQCSVRGGVAPVPVPPCGQGRQSGGSSLLHRTTSCYEAPWLMHCYFTPDTWLVWLSPPALPSTAPLVPTGSSADATWEAALVLGDGSSSIYVLAATARNRNTCGAERGQGWLIAGSGWLAPRGQGTPSRAPLHWGARGPAAMATLS